MKDVKVQALNAPIDLENLVESKEFNAKLKTKNFDSQNYIQPGNHFFVELEVQGQLPDDTVLIQTSGDDLQYKTIYLGSSISKNIKIKLKAPAQDGKYTINLRLKTGDNQVFGEKFWVDIKVMDKVKLDRIT